MIKVAPIMTVLDRRVGISKISICHPDMISGSSFFQTFKNVDNNSTSFSDS